MLPGRNHNRKWLGEFEAQQLLDRHFDFFALRCERDSRSDPGADARTYGRTLAAAGDRSDQCPDAGRVLDPRVLVLPVWFARTRMAGDRPEQPVDQKGLDIENRTGTFSTSSISRTEMLRIYGITAKDLEVIRAAGKKVLPHLDEHIEEFYGWLGTQPEHRIFFSDPERQVRVKQLQRDYWIDFYAGQIDDDYILKRRQVGETHARIGLSLSTYFAGMNSFLGFFQAAVETRGSGAKGQDTIWAMTKLAHLDTALVVESFSAMTTKTITAQSSALIEMSTPVTALWDDILMLPIVGLIDSKRSQDIMDAMLSKVSEARAKVIILDISGVAVVDTAVANHLIKITKATGLMGCECIISGVSPAIARTIVELGIEIKGVKTTSTLQDALAYAFRATGVEVNRTQ